MLEERSRIGKGVARGAFKAPSSDSANDSYFYACSDLRVCLSTQQSRALITWEYGDWIAVRGYHTFNDLSNSSLASKGI